MEALVLRSLSKNSNGITDVPCPSCGPGRARVQNRKRRVLRIWSNNGFYSYKCARCEIAGWAKEDELSITHQPSCQDVSNTEVEQDKSALARFLWSISEPIANTPVETYLRSRSCLMTSPALRFLPAKGEHPPAMIARFGSDAITGVHLTKLKNDGSGKLGTERDKIMIGKSIGQPIVVHNNLDRELLFIAEGIEDAASLAIATGATAWAAGSAGRIATVLPNAKSLERVFIAIDSDHAGTSALRAALSVRPDVIPLHFSKMFLIKDLLDANGILVNYGNDTLLAAIDLGEMQIAYKQGKIGFGPLERAAARINAIHRTDGVFL